MGNKLLLVDDDSHVTSALKRALRREPYEILTAGSGQEALDIMADEEIDVVISDEKMPGMSGTSFLAVVAERYPETIRIILTGEANLQAAMLAVNEGKLYGFFTKPWNHTDLAATIHEALDRKDRPARNRLSPGGAM